MTVRKLPVSFHRRRRLPPHAAAKGERTAQPVANRKPSRSADRPGDPRRSDEECVVKDVVCDALAQVEDEESHLACGAGEQRKDGQRPEEVEERVGGQAGEALGGKHRVGTGEGGSHSENEASSGRTGHGEGSAGDL